jgi:putative transposase
VSNYRRARVPGGTYFLTVVTEHRATFLCQNTARICFRSALESCRQRWPFTIDAIVLLPEHIHTMWTLPPGDSDFPMRWGWIKKEFTKSWLAAGGVEQPQSRSRQRNGRRGIWQRRYWEHAIRDEEDFERHFDYIHYNPVKHGLALSPGDWPLTSFHRWVKAGVYEPHWGSAAVPMMKFDDLSTTAMELVPAVRTADPTTKSPTGVSARTRDPFPPPCPKS